MKLTKTAVLAAFVMCGIGASAIAQMTPTKVVVESAAVRDASRTLTLVATVDPLRRSRVGSDMAGIVANMPVRQGDFVDAGGVICRLDSETLAYRLEEAQSRLAALEAVRAELVNGTRKQDLARLKALLDESSAELTRWEFELKRVENLYEGSQSNAKEMVDARADHARARERKAAAQAAYDLGVEGARAEEILRATADVAAQQAVVRRIDSELRKTTIRAPFAGYVVERNVEVGEWMPGGGQVVEMVELATVLVRVQVPETAVRYLAVGGSVRVVIEALQSSFEGKIKHVIRQADTQARTFPVDIEIANPDGIIAAGMFARATVPAGPAEMAVVVPKDAVVEKEGVSYLALVMPGQQGGMTAMLAPVTVGADVGDWIAITSGNVQSGTQVVTRGNEHLFPFPTPVVLVDKTGTPVTAPTAGAGAPTDKSGG